MTELVCIGCPKGCRLQVYEEENYKVVGNSCPVGAEYGRTELLHPTRVLTATVRIQGGRYSRCPVKSSRPIPKEMQLAVIRQLNQITLQAPVSIGEIVLPHVTQEADMVVTRNMEKEG